MRVVVGLRNPGPDYAGTRHNLGWEAVDLLARRRSESWRRGPGRMRAEVASIRIDSLPVILVAPLTYMNESGAAVRSVLSYYKTAPADLLVAHDDIDLGFGRLRLQNGGGNGGHNGLRSIERSLATREYARLKLGVGRPPGEVDPVDHVLSRFSRAERAEVDLQVADAADVIESWVSDPVRAQEAAAHRRPTD